MEETFKNFIVGEEINNHGEIKHKFVASFDTIEEARDFICSMNAEGQFFIIDKTNKIVK